MREPANCRRGRTAGFPAAPPTNPGVRFSRTGLFRQRLFVPNRAASAFRPKPSKLTSTSGSVAGSGGPALP